MARQIERIMGEVFQLVGHKFQVIRNKGGLMEESHECCLSGNDLALPFEVAIHSLRWMHCGGRTSILTTGKLALEQAYTVATPIAVAVAYSLA